MATIFFDEATNTRIEYIERQLDLANVLKMFELELIDRETAIKECKNIHSFDYIGGANE